MNKLKKWHIQMVAIASLIILMVYITKRIMFPSGFKKTIQVEFRGNHKHFMIHEDYTEENLKDKIRRMYNINKINAMAYDIGYWDEKDEIFKRRDQFLVDATPVSNSILKLQLMENPRIKVIQQAYSKKINRMNGMIDDLKEKEREHNKVKMYNPRTTLLAQQQKAIDDGITDTCQFKNLNRQIGGKLTKREKPVLLYDTTLVNHEIDFLYLRMELLDDVVDYFVVVEAMYTFQQEPKKLFFTEAYQREKRWDKYRHKIIHTIVGEKAPGNFKFWEGEVHIRNGIGTHGLRVEAVRRGATPQPDDLIIINDLDELISPEILKVLKFYHGFHQSIFSMNYRWTYYNFYWENMKRLEKCAISTFDNVVKNQYEANKLRFNCFGKQNTPGVLRIQPTGENNQGICPLGWHCSWCFPLSLFEHKVKSFALEYNQADAYTRSKDKFPKFVQEGIWYRDNKRNARYTPTTTDLPAIRNPEEYPYLFPKEKPHVSCYSVRDFPKCLEGDDYVPPNTPPQSTKAYHITHPPPKPRNPVNPPPQSPPNTPPAKKRVPQRASQPTQGKPQPPKTRPSPPKRRPPAFNNGLSP